MEGKKRRGGKSKAVVNRDGSMDFVNQETGAVEASVPPKSEGKDGRSLSYTRPKSDYDFRWKMVKDGNHVLLPSDVDGKTVDSSYSLYKNKRDLCLEIAMEIASGKTFSDLDKLKHFPSTRTVFYWYARDEEFKKLIDEARRVRAEFYHDELVQVAKDVEEDNARSSKVKADIYKHLMGVNDKERFGQAKQEAPAAATVNIVFQTGIQREAPAQVDNAIPVEGRVIGSSEDN